MSTAELISSSSSSILILLIQMLQSPLLWIFLLTSGILIILYPAWVAAYQPSLPVRHTRLSTSSSQAIIPPTATADIPLLSIVIPAYNEQERLERMLQATYDYLVSSSSPSSLCRALELLAETVPSANHENKTESLPTCPTVEWILVNDGSKDQTSQVFQQFARDHSKPSSSSSTSPRMEYHLLEYSPNAGKGAAVQAGMLHATGHWALMVDADGATEFGSGLEALAHQCLLPTSTSSSTPHVVIASRAELPQQSRTWIRQMTTQGFHFVMSHVILGPAMGRIRDTQCGFKLFARTSRSALFAHLHIRQWAFDIEVLYRAQQLQLPMAEVPIPKWTEVQGSKLHEEWYTLVCAALGMVRDMLCVRICYRWGIWSIESSSSTTTSTAMNHSETTGSKKER
jgi:dolichyl-phosphate beta-glucosyltransferase